MEIDFPQSALSPAVLKVCEPTLIRERVDGCELVAVRALEEILIFDRNEIMYCTDSKWFYSRYEIIRPLAKGEQITITI